MSVLLPWGGGGVTTAVLFLEMGIYDGRGAVRCGAYDQQQRRQAWEAKHQNRQRASGTHNTQACAKHKNLTTTSAALRFTHRVTAVSKSSRPQSDSTGRQHKAADTITEGVGASSSKGQTNPKLENIESKKKIRGGTLHWLTRQRTANFLRTHGYATPSRNTIPSLSLLDCHYICCCQRFGRDVVGGIGKTFLFSSLLFSSTKNANSTDSTRLDSIRLTKKTRKTRDETGKTRPITCAHATLGGFHFTPQWPRSPPISSKAPQKYLCNTVHVHVHPHPPPGAPSSTKQEA